MAGAGMAGAGIARTAAASTVAWLLVAVLGACSGAAQQTGTIALAPVVEQDLRSPVFLTHAGDGSGRLFVVEQRGQIRVIADGKLQPEPFLEITSQVRAGGERGLLGLAFHPEFADNGRLFVNYTRVPDASTIVAEFRLGPDGRAERASERVLLAIPQPYGNHNGGMIAFGPDGYLYVGMGDGGSGGDPRNYAQNPEELLGKMLRIDVDRGDPYGIPDDNPYVAGGGREEIYAIGLRNPWRFSFDRASGELWAGDVGQNAIEEVSVIERGGNYGWRLMEGTRPYEPENGADGLIPPVVEYAHGGGRCSITGGYVYRGAAVPELAGTYVYGDYCSGEIFGLVDGAHTVLLDTGGKSISSFGEDAAGELYVVVHEGAIYRIAAPDGRS